MKVDMTRAEEEIVLAGLQAREERDRFRFCTHPEQAWCDCDWCRLGPKKTKADLCMEKVAAFDTFQPGDTVQGFGLHNAGRHYTVRIVGKTKGRVQLEEHLTGRLFWTFDRWYRVVEKGGE